MSDNLFKKPADSVNAKATEEPNKPAIIGTPSEPPTPPDAAEEAPMPQIDELTVLKQRAKMMGITHSNNIGLDALRAKINAAAQGEPSDDSEDDDTDEMEAATPETPKTLRQKLTESELKLVRIRVTCLDPKKKDLKGEIFTVGNKYLGMIKKFVPFGEQTDNGYHVPNIIYKMMKEREFVLTKVKKTPRGDIVETSMAREFAIEVLPALTPQELADIKASQMSRGEQN